MVCGLAYFDSLVSVKSVTWTLLDDPLCVSCLEVYVRYYVDRGMPLS
ncbi:hypothetical protein HanXRQr2_Chr02g0054171 [Helianthus annuus]|uniref:Uncharacterized protein n=1 Tax=Helianthus annuus TaxID=4232 RepID=A0A9K3NZ86_HELAN|nr:hypothetical protein HanXRQr2_Chr02g0054171 [Helianthus annuus]KAJ0950860.1 hypothetical protein HanPSC8_Chr02g0053221 [Helianthus annuus]